MLKRKVDLSAPMSVVLYGRMSSDEQNPRSPDQQFDEIHRTVKRQNLPWSVIATYRDDGITGRVIRKRPGLMQLIQDIKTGKLKTVKAILVDTYERWPSSWCNAAAVTSGPPAICFSRRPPKSFRNDRAPDSVYSA